jgi:hypothetical protein
MNNSKRPDKASDLTALINEIIEYWKAIAERSFKKAHPFSDPSEFEQNWPRTLDNFFLVATIRTANALRPLSEGCDN